MTIAHYSNRPSIHVHASSWDTSRARICMPLVIIKRICKTLDLWTWTLDGDGSLRCQGSQDHERWRGVSRSRDPHDYSNDEGTSDGASWSNLAKYAANDRLARILWKRARACSWRRLLVDLFRLSLQQSSSSVAKKSWYAMRALTSFTVLVPNGKAW